jgi:hypothetical protein
VTNPGRALGSAIAVVLVLAAVVLGLQASATPSGAAAPPPAGSSLAAPAAVRPPASAQPAPVAPSPRLPARTGPAAARYLSAAWGIDVSWPQCGAAGMPKVSAGFVIVGLTGGRPFTGNPCLAREATFAHGRTGYSAYLNIDAPRTGSASDYGRRVALDGLARVAQAKLRAPTIWLDVEILNHWADPATNVTVINAALRTLHAAGMSAGIYSSGPMWNQITGGASVTVPVWLAMSVTDYSQLGAGCREGFGGRAAVMAQYVATDGHQNVDVDVLCSRGLPKSVEMFAPGAR